MYPMTDNSGVAWEFFGNLKCTEFDNETWGRHDPETGQIFCSQCGRTDHETT